VIRVRIEAITVTEAYYRDGGDCRGGCYVTDGTNVEERRFSAA
jgi:hypothetical protein